jgi:hypothetical protein
MDGHVRAFAVFVAGFHGPKFTDCYSMKQPQFATELLSLQPTVIGMAAKTTNAAVIGIEQNRWRR